MGWSIGHDSRWGKFGRDIGYGVPATCDHPACGKEIDRGLSYVCGSDPLGGDHGCGLYFCGDHLHFEDRGNECPQLCERCANNGEPFAPTPDIAEWMEWKLTDESWGGWRKQNPEEVAAIMAAHPAENSAHSPSEASAGKDTRDEPLIEKGEAS